MRHRHQVTEDPVKVAGIAAIAATIGAIVAMLFTPRDGGQVRRGLKRRANHVKDQVHDKFDHGTADEAAEVADDAKERLQSTATKVAQDVKSTARKVKNDTKATSTRARTTAKRATKQKDS